MKTTTQMMIFSVSLLMLGACANSGMKSSKVSYQVQSNTQLSAYANNVSRGFAKSSKSSRGFVDGQAQYYDGQTSAANLGLSNQSYGGAIQDQVKDCQQYVSSYTQCADADKMISVLAQCLNTVMNYQNPLMTYSYQQLDTQGQQFWTYLLNWKRSSTLDNFGQNDFNILSQYAGQGMLQQY